MGRIKDIYTDAMIEASGYERKICLFKSGGYIIMPSDKEIRGFQKLMNASNIGRF